MSDAVKVIAIKGYLKIRRDVVSDLRNWGYEHSDASGLKSERDNIDKIVMDILTMDNGGSNG